MLFLQQLNCCGLAMKSGIVIEPEDRVAFRKKLYGSIEELQADLDQWLEEFNCTSQGRWCFGKPPMQTFLDAKPIGEEKMIAA
jgi:hypothetical protein